MSTMSPHDVATDLPQQHVERWRRLHDERRFRVEQVAALDGGELAASDRHASVNKALRMAATTTLREVEAALARMDEGRYGRCVTCSQPLTDARLDALPMTPLCASCHYNVQNCRTARA